MSLKDRKIAFIHRLLEVKDEKVITELEGILEEGTTAYLTERRMNKNELNRRVQKAELDFENGKYKSSEQLLTKYQ